MDKQIIQQGISYVINNIAISFASVSDIYTYLDQPIKDVLEFTSSIAFLDKKTDSIIKRFSLSVLINYRNYIAHPSKEPPSITDLCDAVTIISSWYREIFCSSKPLLSLDSEGELIVGLLMIAVKSVTKEDAPAPPRQVPSTPIVKQETDDIEVTSTLRNLRDTEWKDKIKQRKIFILDGKQANKYAKFLYWSGTVAYVRFKGDQVAFGIPIDRNVSVFKSKYDKSQL